MDFLCGNCALEVNESDSAINCDECGQWFHIQCLSIGKDTYEDLVATDRSFSWVCSNCDCTNYSNSHHSSLISHVSENNFSILTENMESLPSLPPPTQVLPQKQGIPKIFKLKVLNVNCQSLVKKKAEFYSLLDTYNPDTGTES